jgi:single-strand DNA-binding protein
MQGLNKVFLLGNLAKDSELKYTPNGKSVLQFSMATSERWIDRETSQKHDKTEWHHVVLWGKVAESLSKYLLKGKTVFVEGKITTRSWDDKDGNKRYKTEINASQVTLVNAARQDYPDAGVSMTGSASEEQNQTPAEIRDEDLPF